MPVAVYDEMREVFNTLSDDELNQLGRALHSGKANSLNAIEKLRPLLNTHAIECLSKGNSKIYKVTRGFDLEPFILKLERFSMSPEIANRFAESEVLRHAVAPLHWNKPSFVDEKYRMIQIQPFCHGGTFESVSLKPRNDNDRISVFFQLFKQSFAFYRALQAKNILFLDGKPTNFTLNLDGSFALTDMKCYVDATPKYLASAECISRPDYFMYIPPPRDLEKVHLGHIGITMYLFLTGKKENNAYEYRGRNLQVKPRNSYDFSAPLFSTAVGEILSGLIQSMLSDDARNRPRFDEAEKIIQMAEKIHFLTQGDEIDKVQKIARAAYLWTQLTTLLKENPDNESLRHDVHKVQNNLQEHLDRGADCTNIVLILERCVYFYTDYCKTVRLLAQLDQLLKENPNDSLPHEIASAKAQFQDILRDKGELGDFNRQLELHCLQTKAVSLFTQLERLVQENPENGLLRVDYFKAKNDLSQLLRTNEDLNYFIKNLERLFSDYFKKQYSILQQKARSSLEELYALTVKDNYSNNSWKAYELAQQQYDLFKWDMKYEPQKKLNIFLKMHEECKQFVMRLKHSVTESHFKNIKNELDQLKEIVKGTPRDEYLVTYIREVESQCTQTMQNQEEKEDLNRMIDRQKHIINLAHNVTKTLKVLTSNECSTVKELIDKYRKNGPQLTKLNTWLGFGRLKKADAVEQALFDTPLHLRAGILSNREDNAVQLNLAKHRFFRFKSNPTGKFKKLQEQFRVGI